MIARLNDKLGDVIESGLRRIAKAPVRISLALFIGQAIIGGGLYSLFEKDADWYDGIYWAQVVMTTVGFGDFSPGTFPGRCVFTMTVFTGILATLIFTGAIAAAITQYHYGEHEDTPELDDDFEALKSHVSKTVDDLSRLQTLASHPYVKDALKRAHEERKVNGKAA